MKTITKQEELRIRKLLDSLYSELEYLDPTTKEYGIVLNDVKCLYDILEHSVIDKDILKMVGTVLIVFSILIFEKTDVLSTKALRFI